jgi:ferredoxin
MPENYIALFSTPNSAEEVNHILAAAVPALEQTAAAIESSGPVTEPKPTVFGKFMTYIVNPIFYATCVHDRAFTVDDSCIGCGKCATLCPMNNIELQGGKPRWNGHCTHCMACISYCPKAAIAYGKKSRTRRIYTCPPYRPADR